MDQRIVGALIIWLFRYTIFFCIYLQWWWGNRMQLFWGLKLITWRQFVWAITLLIWCPYHVWSQVASYRALFNKWLCWVWILMIGICWFWLLIILCTIICWSGLGGYFKWLFECKLWKRCELHELKLIWGEKQRQTWDTTVCWQCYNLVLTYGQCITISRASVCAEFSYSLPFTGQNK